MINFACVKDKRRKNMSRYESAREIYESLGVDTEKAIETLRSTAVSVHCWQGDDVTGFDSKQALSGGIQTTGNYPGKARTPEELMQDFDFAASLMPGKKKLNLHASYAIFENGATRSSRAILKNGSSSQRNAAWESISIPHSSRTRW